MTDLASENQQLRRQFRELLDKASGNQAVLEKFQQFELAMLSAGQLDDLIKTLLDHALRHFSLADCRLVWLERHLALRDLVPETASKSFAYRLLFNGLQKELDALFPQPPFLPVLRTVTAREKGIWFPGESQVQSAAVIPLVCDGVLAGAYLLGSSDAMRFSADKAVDFMAHMGLIASMCLQNSANKERIHRLSMMDNLTQVKNRRCFDSDISKEVARAQRSGEPLSCLFLDADWFKSINDTHGHQAGDEILCALARWVSQQLREGDHLARYGGEEFAVLLPQCSTAMAMQVADRIRLFVRAQEVPFAGKMLRLTVSIGVSTFPGERFPELDRDVAIRTLLRQADAAVYDAKQSGRDRVCIREFIE